MKRISACVTMAARFAGVATIGIALATIGGIAQTAHPGTHSVSAVRHWSNPGSTRVAIEVSGEFEYRSDRLHNPERVYYDILNARPRFDGKRLYTEDLDDQFVKRIRVAETTPGVTRIVFDLAGDTAINASILTSPDRLIIELRRVAAPTSTDPPPATSVAAPITPAPLPAPIAPPQSAPLVKPVSLESAKSEPARVEPTKPEPVKLDPPRFGATKVDSVKPDPAPSRPMTTPSVVTAVATPPATPSVATSPASIPSTTIPKAARRTSTGETSLVRALGLKLQRIVIDPGHGGHDEGTQGPKGLLEKDLVLDVSLRLGKLIEEKMGSEVIYTRSDDTFIPLEGRTALANEKKADLFLSVHANSSPVPRITGVETYYLNFTDSKDAMEVASRENAGSEQSISDLRDLIQKISLHDKASESRDFAERIQSALFAFSSRTFTAEKNRGVKKAPFVVLIGANMPSVLAEIGFVSNTREEALLKKQDYRQRLAEALYHGVAKYADSLSHFQVAAN
jgi:N-acetylmuramoyl-L-alanine amidase